MDQGTRNGITLIEAFTYILMLSVILFGFYLAVQDETAFRNSYVPEDGVLETATAIMLCFAGILTLVRYFREKDIHPRIFSIMSIIIALMFFFVAGEEISWGQRIFDVESSEFFLENNRQNETNLHNLEVGGVNLNKLIFGQILVLFLVLYYLVSPYLYSRRGRYHRFLSGFYIPVPKIHHGLMMLSVGLLIDQVPSTKKGELNEICLGFFALLLATHAQNVRKRAG